MAIFFKVRAQFCFQSDIGEFGNLTRDFDEYLSADTWSQYHLTVLNLKNGIFDTLVSRFDFHAKTRLTWEVTKKKLIREFKIAAEPHDLRFFPIPSQWMKMTGQVERLSVNVSRRHKNCSSSASYHRIICHKALSYFFFGFLISQNKKSEQRKCEKFE